MQPTNQQQNGQRRGGYSNAEIRSLYCTERSGMSRMLRHASGSAMSGHRQTAYGASPNVTVSQREAMVLDGQPKKEGGAF